MKIVKKIGILAGVILLSAGFEVCQAADAPIKVAMVNVQQILQQSPRVAELSKKLEGQFKPRQTKISEQQKSLQDEMEKVNKEKVTMTQKQQDAADKKIAEERQDLVKQVVAYQQDLQKEQGKVMQGILSDINGIVSKLASSQSYAFVLDSQAVVWAGNGTDITKDVAKEFNK